MFIRNAWYAASWAADLVQKPVARTILNDKIVLFRNASGQAAALEDRCCHRAAPLSLGEVCGDHIACGYHGLKFDVAGHCVEVPSQEHIPTNARVKSYPLHEKWNVVWIWMGEPERADPALIIDMPWLQDAKWSTTPGYLHAKTNYQFILDNLLDFTHVTYVHKKTLAGDPREANTPTTVERLNNGIRVGRGMLDFIPPPLFAKAGGFAGNVDRWQFVTWHAPGTVYLDVGCAKVGTGAAEGDRSQGISIWSSHLITPETEESSHYFFCYARDFAIDDPVMSTTMYEGSKSTFEEDVDMLAAVQANREGGSLDGLIHINADAAQLQARRAITQLLAAEASCAS